MGWLSSELLGWGVVVFLDRIGLNWTGPYWTGKWFLSFFYFVVIIFRYVTQHMCLLKYLYIVPSRIMYDRTQLVFTNNGIQR
jgi:hypothetical protein